MTDGLDEQVRGREEERERAKKKTGRGLPQCTSYSDFISVYMFIREPERRALLLCIDAQNGAPKRIDEKEEGQRGVDRDSEIYFGVQGVE